MGGLLGGGGMVGGGMVKGQLSLGAAVTSVVRQRMEKAPAVQTGRALPLGRCAAPPPPPPPELVWPSKINVCFLFCR